MNMKAVYEAYQGEDIEITLKGTGDYNLDSIQFTLTVYPCSDISDIYSVAKSSCTKISSNQYKAIIPSSVSKTMTTGPYTIEVLDSTNRKIYQKKGRMILNASASKNL